MKKISILLLTCLLLTGMTAGPVLAKSDQGSKSSSKSESKQNKSSEKQKDSNSSVTGTQAETAAPAITEVPAAPATEPTVTLPPAADQPAADNAEAVEQDKPDKDKQEKEKKEKTNNGNGHANGHAKDNTSAKAAGVTDDVYGSSKGKQGYKGLLNAMNNVKDKPAGQVLANLLLTRYEAQLTPEMQSELEQIREPKEALAKAADLLEAGGNVEEAAGLQEQVIQADPADLDSYQRLDELTNRTADKSNELNLFINGEQVTGAAPVVQSGTTLVPFRVVSEALSADVTWNAKDKSVTVVKDGKTITLYVNQKAAKVNGKKVSLQAAPVMKKGTIQVPVRVISEALGATVKWEPVSETVVIYEEKTSS
ncbi:copper amine oxidase N-terminal domain-containing protein [Paenibacillus sp. Z6-24]